MLEESSSQERLLPDIKQRQSLSTLRLVSKLTNSQDSLKTISRQSLDKEEMAIRKQVQS